MSLATVNPYANHPALSELEAEVLWEYARLSSTIKNIGTLARETAQKPNDQLLDDLRDLERKMKLVFTSYQTSVYRMTQDYLAAEEAKFESDQAAAAASAAQRAGDASGYDRTQYQHQQYDESMEGDSTIRY